MIVYKLKYEDYQSAILDLISKGVYKSSRLDYNDHIEAVVLINKIQLTEGTYDDNDRVLTEPTYENGFFVDVMSTKVIEFNNIVTPQNPVHVFANN